MGNKLFIYVFGVGLTNTLDVNCFFWSGRDIIMVVFISHFGINKLVNQLAITLFAHQYFTVLHSQEAEERFTASPLLCIVTNIKQ